MNSGSRRRDAWSTWLIHPIVFVFLGGAVGGLAVAIFGLATWALAPPDFPGDSQQLTLRDLMVIALMVLYGPVVGFPAAMITGLASAPLKKWSPSSRAYVCICTLVGVLAGGLAGNLMIVGEYRIDPVVAGAGGIAALACSWVTRPRENRR